MVFQSKKHKSLATKLGDNMKLYGVGEALQTLRDLKTTKFDETVEVALNLGVDPRHADQMVRGMVTLPSALSPRVPTRLAPKT
jgi:large subunit ribosomal protein L1